MREERGSGNSGNAERIHIKFEETDSKFASCGRVKVVWYGPDKDAMSCAMWEGDWSYGLILLDVFESIVPIIIRSGETGSLAIGYRYKHKYNSAASLYIGERLTDDEGVERISIGCAHLRPESVYKVFKRIRIGLEKLVEVEEEEKG